MLRTIAAITILAALAGCIPLGPQDGFVHIAGIVPPALDQKCKVEVRHVGTNRQPMEWPVSGTFKAGFVVNPSRKGHNAKLRCGGDVIAVTNFRYGKDVGMGEVVLLTEQLPNKSLERTREK